MSVEDDVKEFIERTTSEALADKRVQALLSGEMIPDEVRAFFRSFIVTHLNSVQILSFLFSIVPRGPSDLVKENLLEEMGLEESEKSHPDMLIDLARGLGFSQQDILRLSAEADEVRRSFSSSKVPYGTLRDLGLFNITGNRGLRVLSFQGQRQYGQCHDRPLRSFGWGRCNGLRCMGKWISSTQKKVSRQS